MTYDPNTTTGIVQRMDERIRALERLANAPGPFGVIQAKGDLIVGLGPGNPTRKAVAPDGQTIVGDSTSVDGWGYAPLGGSSGGWWDAIIDPDLPASDPANHLFTTLFEALPHYASQGQATFVFRDSNFTGITETMDAPVAPASVMIIGAPSASLEELAAWNIRGHSAHVQEWRISGVEITSSASPLFSYPTGLFLTLQDCRIATGRQLLPATTGNEVDALRCLFQGVNIPASRIFLQDCDILAGGNLGGTEVLGTVQTSLIVMDGVNLSGTGALTIDALRGYLYGVTATRATRNSVGTPGPTPLNLPSNFAGVIVAGGEAQSTRGSAVCGLAISAPSAMADLALYGHFESVQISQPTANGLHGDFSVSESFDIMGPCNARITKLDGVQGAAGTLRGIGNNLDLITAAGDTGTYTTLALSGVTDSSVRVSSRRTALSGTQTPYSFDAACGRNFLDFAGASTYPGPGVDLGQANVVRTEVVSYGFGQSGQGGSTYTFGPGDGGTVVEGNSASAQTFTIPPHASVPLPVGTIIEVHQFGAGQITIAAGTGVTLFSDGAKVKTAAQYASIGLRQRALDQWVLTGDLA